MKYKIEFELPDNDTVLKEIKQASVGWTIWGYSGLAKAVPSIDAVKHGRWIAMSDADGVYWACSECGEDLPRISHYNPQFDLFPRLESIDKTNYCPNCGADMRKRKEE